MPSYYTLALTPPSYSALLTCGILDLFTSQQAMQGSGVMVYGRARPDDLPRTKDMIENKSLGGLLVITSTENLTGMEEIAHVGHPR